ncbi:hypothetical protein HNQ08_000386 [Deinococcus humi]|uniref:Uncharacterized protein n=1 Tax=Deinococcus humi TaxID=662880 RepID=A0A7W8JQY4_9DEIO|nr:hypothetical protein [Deinococcus humi]
MRRAAFLLALLLGSAHGLTLCRTRKRRVYA